MSLNNAVGLVASVAVVVTIVGALAWFWLSAAAGEVRRERRNRLARFRSRRAHFAAVEAAEDNPGFGPAAIEAATLVILSLARVANSGIDTRELDSRPDAPLITAWAKLRRQWIATTYNRSAAPRIDVLRVVNRGDDDEDQVVVRVRLNGSEPHSMVLRPVHPEHHLDERWTLGRDGDTWLLRSVDGDPLTEYALTTPLIPNRSFDDERLSEESLAELADRQKVVDDITLVGLVGADEPAGLAVLDLSVLDGRFMPPLIEAIVLHLIDAWILAVAGSTAPLKALASESACRTLLTPGPNQRIILRDAVLTSWKPTELRLARTPPALDIAVFIEAIRFIAADDGTLQLGNKAERRPINLGWRLELTDVASSPWRLAATSNPADAIHEPKP